MSMAEGFEALLQQATQVYEKDRAALVKQREEIDAKIEELDTRWKAASGRSAPKKSGGGQRTSRKAEILALIKSKPHGIARASILETLGVRGDKSAENSVSTALANMKKKGEIDNNDGIYTAK